LTVGLGRSTRAGSIVVLAMRLRYLWQGYVPLTPG
jgi:hypothetical protein